jgi:hypothetical protein
MVLVGLVGLMKSDHYALLREIINSYSHKDTLLENAVDDPRESGIAVKRLRTDTSGNLNQTCWAT